MRKSGAGHVNNTFTGDGGPSVGNFFNRLVYALKFQDEQILLSDAINEKSQILYDRHPRERVEKLAPYLEIDRNSIRPSSMGRSSGSSTATPPPSDYPYSAPQPLQ